MLLVLVGGCVPLMETAPESIFPLSISMIAPTEDSFVPPGGTVRIKWIDEGMEPGALVYLKSVSTDESGDQAEVDILARRDAVADDDADVFFWNGTDASGNTMPARVYQIFGVIENPDGMQDIRPLGAKIVIPFSFVEVGAGGKKGILNNNSGNGPFFLQDNTAAFVTAGVSSGGTVKVLGGSGSVIGTYTITGVTETRLTLESDAGDSGGEDDVRYVAPLNNPAIQDVEGLVTIVWQDAEYAANSTITLEVDPDTDSGNNNETVIRQGVGLKQDGTGDMFDWDGTDTDGNRVAAGAYFLRAVLNAGASNELVYLFERKIVVSGVAPTLQLTDPGPDQSPDPGGTVNIAWTDSDPDDDATITLFVDPDTDVADPSHNSGNEITIKGGISEDSDVNSYDWVTAGTAAGTYTIVGRITDASNSSAISSAPGRVTLQNSPPVLEWVRPAGTTADADTNNNNGPFRFIDGAAHFTADYGDASTVVRNLVFKDNYVKILEDTGGVFAGSYPVGEDPTSATELILSSNPGDSDNSGDVQYEITGDINLLRGTSPTFDFRTHDPEEAALLDLILDFDDDLTNGNEVKILDDFAVPNSTTIQDRSFTWTNTQDVNFATVDPGAYRLVAEMDDANPRDGLTTVEFDGKVLLRTGVDQPAIILKTPDLDGTPSVGQKVAITWDDLDTDANTTITLRYDDDPIPNEAVETNAAEVDIVTGINADEDDGGGVGESDLFGWDWHPVEITAAAVGEGDYYIFAYIGNNGNPVTNPDMIAVATAKTSIPNTPPEFEFTTPGDSNAEIASPGGGNITWSQREPDAGDSISVDIWLDPDDTFDEDQAKEIQIANNYTGGSPFVWDGTDAFSANTVETGQYRIVAVINENSDDITVDDMPGLVNFRPDTFTSVINIASQFQDVDVTQESSLDINWRAVPVSAADEFVEVYYDDDSSTADDLGTRINTHDLITTENALNTYSWELDTNVPVGDYYVHARLAQEMAAGTTAELANGGGGGPFVLTDAGGDFVNDGVQAGDEVRILSGTGATVGSYVVAGGGVAATTLTLTADAGDSGGTTDVSYRVINELDTSTSNGVVSVATSVTATFDFVSPSGDQDVVTAVGSVNIIWDYTSGESGTITLKADPDSTNNNANEITILDNRAQAAATSGTTDSLNWTLQDTTPADVPTGEYIIRGIFSLPSSSLINREASGHVKVRASATAPLVKMTSPTSNTTFDQNDVPSQAIQISWEVDDPSPASAPKVDIWYDEDQSPEASAGNLADGAALGGAAVAIAEDIDATPSTYIWTPPAAITATADKTYYIHIRIRDGALPADDDRDTATGKIKINP
jgi:flagellar hook assembly protein FlgD